MNNDDFLKKAEQDARDIFYESEKLPRDYRMFANRLAQVLKFGGNPSLQAEIDNYRAIADAVDKMELWSDE